MNWVSNSSIWCTEAAGAYAPNIAAFTICRKHCRAATQACIILALLSAVGLDGPSSHMGFWDSGVLESSALGPCGPDSLVAWRKFKPAVDSQPSLASPPHLDPGGAGELTHQDSGHQTLVVELAEIVSHWNTCSPDHQLHTSNLVISQMVKKSSSQSFSCIRM